MKKEIIDRTLEEALYIIETKQTIRDLTKVFNVSKSTIHKDLSERLKNINLQRYKEVEEILKQHLNTRHIKGGESTRKKYKKLK